MASDLELLEKQLGEFCCARDKDVEKFITTQAIRYERSGMSRTYLYLLVDGSKMDIAAYFTLSVTAADYTGVSHNTRKKVLGGTPGRNTQNHFGGLLIAQLARNDNYYSADISGAEMMRDCEALLEQGRDIVGSRALYLDCRQALIDFYNSFGYSLLSPEPFPSGFFKMVRVPPKL
jgi:hypothetical protein